MLYKNQPADKKNVNNEKSKKQRSAGVHSSCLLFGPIQVLSKSMNRVTHRDLLQGCVYNQRDGICFLYKLFVGEVRRYIFYLDHHSLSKPLDKKAYFKYTSIFLFLNQNICCGYSKEPSQRDGSYEHPKQMLKLIN